MLSRHNIELVRSYLKGKKLEKFDTSIQILEDSMTQGSWVSRGSVKYSPGRTQGLCNPIDSKGSTSSEFYLYMTLRYGSTPRVEVVTKELYVTIAPKKNPPSLEVVQAWCDLINEIAKVVAMLDQARPKPTITPVGLSPKVTKTLKEMAINLDLSSITVPEIEMREVEGEVVPFVRWSPGVKFNRSRFHCGCQACGRPIPSGMYVPIESRDLNSGDLIGLWVGCDCAKNIFGVKDIGVKK